MGLPDTDNTSDGFMGQLWDNVGDIVSQTYADDAGICWGGDFFDTEI